MKEKKKTFIHLLITQLLICLVLSDVNAFELKVDNPNYIPPEHNGFSRFRCGNAHEEVEYESTLGIIDSQTYKSNECQLFTGFVPWSRIMIGVDLFYDFDREYELKFGPQSDRAGDPNYQSNASGILDPDIVFAYEFRAKRDNWNQQVYFKMNPFDIEEKPRSIYRGGHDIFLEYRFSHSYDENALYGSLFSHYFGKKNFYQPGDSRVSVKEAYTEVGLNLGYLFRINEKWSLQSGGVFALSSDYDVITPEIKKTADKGYIIGFDIAANYFMKPNLGVQVSYSASSRIYNATNEDISQDIDYEIEKKSFFVGLLYNWDLSESIKGLLK